MFLDDIGGFLSDAATKVYETGSGLVTKVVNKIDRYTDAPLQLTDSLTNLLGSNTFLIGIALVGGLIAISILKGGGSK